MFFWRTIEDAFIEYEFFLWGEEVPEGELVEFFDSHEARLFLSWLCRRDPFKLSFLRDLFTNENVFGLYELHRMDGSEVLDSLSRELGCGHIMVVERDKPKIGWAPVLQAEDKPEQANKPQDRQELADSWVVLKIVDDATGIAASGVKLKIKFADGYDSEYPAGLTGKIDIRAIASGNCEIGCDIQDTYIGDCYCYVAGGESPSGKKGDSDIPGETEVPQEQMHIQGSSMVEVEKYKVTDGQTLEIVAKDHGLTWQQLAYFNFGTKDPKKVDRMLAYNVGCEKKAPDGKTYEFQSSDSPGILYIPKPWTGLKLDTGQEHTLRVKKLSPAICIDFEIDLDDPDTQDDEIYLEATDESWKHKIPVKELEESGENWVSLMFPKPPKDKKLNLILDTKNEGEQFYIFQEITLDDIYSLSSEEE